MGRREEKKAEKRQRMLAAGLSLFLAHGYERASIEQIVASSGVARGTFYLYYRDKAALFQALVDAWFEPLMGLLDDVQQHVGLVEDPDALWQVYRDMGTGLAWIGLANRDEILLSFREMRGATVAGHLLRERESALIEVAVGFTKEATRRGMIEVPNARVTVLVILGACERLFYEVLTGGDLGDVEEISGLVVAMFEGALRK